MFKSNTVWLYENKAGFKKKIVLSVHHIPFRTRFATCARDHGNTVHNLENTITFLMSPINCTTQMIELYAYIYIPLD